LRLRYLASCQLVNLLLWHCCIKAKDALAMPQRGEADPQQPWKP
jgi:hypothetical protein